jgi:cytochrome c oxidase assembly factor CtaG
MALVGVALITASDVVYAPYAHGASALGDQHAAGMVMWIGGTLVLATATVALGWAALRREERRQLARDAHVDRSTAARSGAPPA